MALGSYRRCSEGFRELRHQHHCRRDGGHYTNNFANIFIVTNTTGTVTNYLDLGAAATGPSRYYRVRLVP